MPTLQLKNVSQPAEIRLSDAAFGRAYNEALVHQVVTAYMAAGRAGTKRQKSRAEVRGGGKKPWAQKGTGQARAGSIRSPIWVGGGRAFAARPRDYSQKVNRKMYRAAMQSMVSELVRQDRLIAIESLELSAPKTKLLIAKLQEFGLSRALILVEAYDEKLFLAARNVPYVDVMAVSALDPLSLIKHDKVLATVGALKLLEQRLGGAQEQDLEGTQEPSLEGGDEQVPEGAQGRPPGGAHDQGLGGSPEQDLDGAHVPRLEGADEARPGGAYAQRLHEQGLGGAHE